MPSDELQVRRLKRVKRRTTVIAGNRRRNSRFGVVSRRRVHLLRISRDIPEALRSAALRIVKTATTHALTRARSAFFHGCRVPAERVRKRLKKQAERRFAPPVQAVINHS